MRTFTLRSLALVGLFACLMILALRFQPDVAAQATNCVGGTLPGDPGTIPTAECLYLPIIDRPPSQAVYTALDVDGAPLSRPAVEHPDINLAVRGYTPVTATLELLDINGPIDANAPQLGGMFTPPRLPEFVATYRVYDWDWGCGEGGCLGEPLTQPEVTLLALAVTPGEPIAIPWRGPQIDESGHRAMVLYADEQRITFTYTREDSAVHGYLIHLEDLRVDPNLVALYQQLDAAGRGMLPALHNGERLGDATSEPLKVAVRDTGSFLDPRSRKDWWMEYLYWALSSGQF